MSDEGIGTNHYSSANSGRKSKKSSDAGSAAERRYAQGGSAGARKQDNPAGWTRTPTTRAGANRRSGW